MINDNVKWNVAKGGAKDEPTLEDLHIFVHAMVNHATHHMPTNDNDHSECGFKNNGNF